MADGIKLRLGRRDMNVFRTIETDAKVVVHVAGRPEKSSALDLP